ncbi:energy transducer TonB [Longimicrobium sp.]|jgi:protein TonB|uniref:energy transducer TonB n=1 Tax=Longimicrobium sp. TaxID=2029185 RepID=UPI002ED9622C
MSIHRYCIPALLVALAAVPARAQMASPSDTVYAPEALTVPPRALNVAEFGELLGRLYPAQLRDAGASGRVDVRFVVGANGIPRDAAVLASTDSLLQAPALAAVMALRFSPAEVEGRPVATWAAIPVSWEAPAPPPPTAEPAATAESAPTLAPGHTYEVEDVDEPPRLLNRRLLTMRLEQEYPAVLRDAGLGGEVEVRFRVSPSGEASDFSIRRSSDPQFNAVSMNVLRGLRFAPARLKGEPVAVWLCLPIQWRTAR